MFAVRITEKDEDGNERTYVEEKYAHSDREIAKQWARDALRTEKVLTAEVIPWTIHSRETLDEMYKRWDDAVTEYGEEETFKDLELVITSRELQNKNKATILQKHPAFQLIPRDQQYAIHKMYDIEAIRALARRLLSTIAVRHELRPISKGAQFDQWIAVIHKLRQIYHPAATAKPTTTGKKKR